MPTGSSAKPPAAVEGIAVYLEWDHRRLDALFDTSRGDARRGDWSAAIAKFREFAFGLRRHIEVEETMLFPVLEARTGHANLGPTAVMRLEHRQIQGFLAQAAAACEENGLDRLEEAAAALMDVLVQHNRKEENILYPMCDSAMDDTARERLVTAMQAA